MRKVAAAIVLALTLSGCSTAGILSAATSALTGGSGPEVTAQVGAENTKQGIGLNTKVESTEKTTVGDVSGGSAVTQTKTTKAQQVETGSVTATNMKVVTSDPYPLLISFAIGMFAVLGLIFWFIPTPKQLLAASKEE